MQDKVVKKAIDKKAKASLQPSFKTRKIDSKCLKGYRLSIKKDKDKNNYWDIDKVKPHNSLFANISQLQTQASKND